MFFMEAFTLCYHPKNIYFIRQRNIYVYEHNTLYWNSDGMILAFSPGIRGQSE